MNKRVHVIGAGLAGLSASLELAQRGVRVVPLGQLDGPPPGPVGQRPVVPRQLAELGRPGLAQQVLMRLACSLKQSFGSCSGNVARYRSASSGHCGVSCRAWLSSAS